MVAKLPKKGPKTLDQITKKILAQNKESKIFTGEKYNLHIYSHGIQNLQQSFENLLLVTLVRGKMLRNGASAYIT